MRPFFSNCVSWLSNAPLDALEWLCENADEIDIDDFLQRVDAEDIARISEELGYSPEGEPGLSLRDDYHVRFHLERRTGVPFMVHSAIEYVFADNKDIERIADLGSMDRQERSTLVLVHPGSLRGSARALIGKFDADAARSEIMHEVAGHGGGLIIIDGALSDELEKRENALITHALERSASAGHVALRLWGCDSGEMPYPEWESYGIDRESAIFQSQEDAIAAVAGQISDATIVVTGAWASEDGSTGCVCSVADQLRISSNARILISDCALMEPFEQDDQMPTP